MKINRIVLLLIGMMFLFFLVACSEEVAVFEEVEFEPGLFIDDEEVRELARMEEDQLGVFDDYIKSMDYVIDSIITRDRERDYFFDNTLGKSFKDVLKDQLLYMEIHREYMKYLYDRGASYEDLMFQNRLFNKSLRIFMGQKFNEGVEIKRVLEKNFSRYNVLELDTIVRGDDLDKFIDDYRFWEISIGYTKWFMGSERADYEGNLLVEAGIVLDNIPLDDRSSISRLVEIGLSIDDLLRGRNFFGVDSDKVVSDTLDELLSMKKEVNSLVLQSDLEWIRERSLGVIGKGIGVLEKISQGEVFRASDELFLNSLEDVLNIVSLSLLSDVLENGFSGYEGESVYTDGEVIRVGEEEFSDDLEDLQSTE